GRLKWLKPGEAGPKTPAFKLEFENGGRLVLTEAGSRKRAGVWLLTPEAAEEEVVHVGPDALEVDADRMAEILASDSRRLHPLLRDQRAIAGIGRAWSNEILHAAQLSPYALSTQVDTEETARRVAAMQSELRRGLELRERGASDARTYRVHKRLGEPCHVCGTPIARVDFEEHTIYYCPTCQTGGRGLQGPRPPRPPRQPHPPLPLPPPALALPPLHGQPEPVVLADRPHPCHVVLARPRLEDVRSGTREEGRRRCTHVVHHAGRSHAVHPHLHGHRAAVPHPNARAGHSDQRVRHQIIVGEPDRPAAGERDRV